MFALLALHSKLITDAMNVNGILLKSLEQHPGAWRLGIDRLGCKHSNDLLKRFFPQ
jgi:hypothetical protein